MLQSLSEQRFALKVHVEKRTVPIYNLVVDKKGLKLQPSAANANPSRVIVHAPRLFPLAAYSQNVTRS
jgi:uncharacterized protein (TIGR03435 family)